LSKLTDVLVDKRVFFAFPASLVVLLVAQPTITEIYLGLPLLALGVFLRAWASGYIYKTKKLADVGPYSLTRNPLYLGSFISTIGFLVAAGLFSGWRIALGLTFVLMFWLVYTLKVLREEAHLTRIFGDLYMQYQKTVPRFRPRLTGYRSSADASYSFHQLMVDHKEWQAWIGLCALLAFLFWRLKDGALLDLLL
jgi:protein-S-isoprenylcysteine O-methyltransferase Ste14